MKVLLLDNGGNFLDFALQCLANNHEVKWFIAKDKNGNVLPIGKGMVERVYDWTKWMRWADIVILSDNAKYMDMMEPYRKYGYPIFGCPKAGADLELNRSTGQDLLKSSGVDILPYKTFTDYDAAEAYVTKTMKRYVSKPSGDADKALSYVSKSPADMIYMLRKWKKLGKLKAPFILQEFCPGVEMAVGGWFGPGGWNSAINENWEHKKLMNGEKGVNTGEQGTVMRYVDKSKLAEKVLFPASQALLDMGYTGYIDVAVIVSEEDGTPYPMEYTCRFGWPHFQIVTSLHDCDPVEWMADLLDGYDSLRVKTGIATGVVCTIPDFPYNKLPREELCGIPVYCDQNKNIHPAEIMLGSAPTMEGNKIVDRTQWVTAGNYVLVTTGVASTVSASSKKAYEVMKGIELPNSPAYRTDIGDRLKKELPTFQKYGYATGMTY